MNCVLLMCMPVLTGLLLIQSDKSMTGNWRVISAELTDQIQLDDAAFQQFESFTDAFLGSVIEFKKNGKSTMRTRVPQFQYSDHYWEYDKGLSTITIRKSKQSAASWEFLVAEKNDNMVFLIKNSPFVLTVKKIKK